MHTFDNQKDDQSDKLISLVEMFPDSLIQKYSKFQSLGELFY